MRVLPSKCFLGDHGNNQCSDKANPQQVYDCVNHVLALLSERISESGLLDIYFVNLIVEVILMKFMLI